MLTLALDTTTRSGSHALRRDGRLLREEVGDGAKTHGERLPADIIDLLAREQLRVSDIDLYGVAAGPGSFTGLRIGIAAIQGLALVHRKPVAAVSALDALAGVASLGFWPAELLPAHTDDGTAAVIAVWMDGQRQQVFSALYSCPSPGSVTVLDDPRAEPPDRTLARWAESRTPRQSWLFIGDGALVYRSLIEAAGWNARIVDPTPPLAAQIAVMAERMAAAGLAGSPNRIRPLYVRRSDAELARERRAVLLVEREG